MYACISTSKYTCIDMCIHTYIYIYIYNIFAKRTLRVPLRPLTRVHCWGYLTGGLNPINWPLAPHSQHSYHGLALGLNPNGVINFAGKHGHGSNIRIQPDTQNVMLNSLCLPNFPPHSTVLIFDIFSSVAMVFFPCLPGSESVNPRHVAHRPIQGSALQLARTLLLRPWMILRNPWEAHRKSQKFREHLRHVDHHFGFTLIRII